MGIIRAPRAWISFRRAFKYRTADVDVASRGFHHFCVLHNLFALAHSLHVRFLPSVPRLEIGQCILIGRIVALNILLFSPSAAHACQSSLDLPQLFVKVIWPE